MPSIDELILFLSAIAYYKEPGIPGEVTDFKSGTGKSTR